MKKICVMIFAFTSLNVWGTVKITDLGLKKIDNQSAIIELNFDKELTSNPEILIKDNMVQITLSDTIVWPKIEKQINLFASNRSDTTITAYQFDRNVVRARAILPFSLAGKETQGQMRKKNKGLEVIFPLQEKTTTMGNLTKYDEAYLDQLIKGKSESVQQISDQVKNTNSSIEKSGDLDAQGGSGISYAGYFLKFITFLLMVLGIFYGIVWSFKKGVLKKGKFALLNSTNIVTVLSTSYLAPKQSLILVKVYEQVFLLGSTDKGLAFLSEIKDVPGLLKSGEKQLTGNNFDSDLLENEKAEKVFSLKDDINQSQEEMGAKVKFSEQIKKKMKKLRPLQ